MVLERLKNLPKDTLIEWDIKVGFNTTKVIIKTIGEYWGMVASNEYLPSYLRIRIHDTSIPAPTTDELKDRIEAAYRKYLIGITPEIEQVEGSWFTLNITRVYKYATVQLAPMRLWENKAVIEAGGNTEYEALVNLEVILTDKLEALNH